MVTASMTPSADQVVAFFNFLQEAGNFFRVVLQIAVHGNDDFAAGKIETGFQAGGLAEIAAQAHKIDSAVMLINVGENFEGVIAASVVDKHQLVRFADGIHNFGELHVQGWDVFLFVEERDDDRVAHRRFTSHAVGKSS